MSYEASEIKCDWCIKHIYSGEDVACRKCYEELEGQVGDLEKEVESLRADLTDVEKRYDELVETTATRTDQATPFVTLDERRAKAEDAEETRRRMLRGE